MAEGQTMGTLTSTEDGYINNDRGWDGAYWTERFFSPIRHGLSGSGLSATQHNTSILQASDVRLTGL